MNQEQLGQACGWDGAQGRISNYERDDRRPTPQELNVMARVLRVKVDDLLSPDAPDEYPPLASANASRLANVRQALEPKGTVPLISWVSAGAWEEAFDPFSPGSAYEWIETDSVVSRSAFALKVRGDSMDNPKGEPTFPDGSIIIVEPALRGSIKSGDFIVARASDWDEATFKQFVKDAGVSMLKPLNPQWQTIHLPLESIICGKVVEKVIRRKY